MTKPVSAVGTQATAVNPAANNGQNKFNEDFVADAAKDFAGKHWIDGVQSVGRGQDQQTKEYTIGVIGDKDALSRLPNEHTYKQVKIKVEKHESGGQVVPLST